MAGSGRRQPGSGPDDGVADCNTDNTSQVPTGSRRACVSSVGAFDLVGNLDEWVADWMPRSAACGIWSSSVDKTIDLQCLAGAETAGEPGTFRRGGDFSTEVASGVLTIDATNIPSLSDPFVHRTFGFRCTR